jgi:hypothetical protein
MFEGARMVFNVFALIHHNLFIRGEKNLRSQLVTTLE